MSRICTCAFFLIFFGASLVGRAQTTIHVPADQPTIQDGIDAANNGDTVLVSPGSYTENIDFKGKAITVTSGATSYSGAATTILQPKLTGPIVIFQSGETRSSVFNGFSLQHGNSTAIYMPAGSPTISNNVVANGYGCGMVARGSNSGPSIQGNHLTANHAVLPVTHSYADCGVPSEPAMGTVNGGALIGLLEAGDVEVIGNLIDNNDLTTDNGTTTNECGEGICGLGAGKVLIESNTIRNNLLNGAAIGVIQFQDLSIVQNLVFGNTVIGSAVGGGSGSGTLALVNNTVYGNTFPTEPLYDDESKQVAIGSVGQAIVENNLFVSSDFRPGMTCGNLPQTTVIAHNDVLNTGLISAPVCPNYGAGSNLAVDPQFIDPANGDFHTQPTSPVVASGDSTAPDIPPADLDGKARTVCGTIDMGVYEIRPHPPITLASLPNPSVGGSSVAFTAKLTGNCKVPTGTVTFLDGSNPLGTAAIDQGGSAVFNTAALTVGSHNITATYAGDFNFEDSISNTVVQVVSGYPTSTILQVSPNPARALQAITLSASTSSQFGTPTGTVSFYAGTTLLGSATLTASGSATTTNSTLGAGTYTIHALYNATTQFAQSASTPIVITVLGDNTAVSLRATPTPSMLGQAVTLAATVSSGQPASGAPTGTVNFLDGGATIGTSPVSASGVATFTTSSLSLGSHSITASYLGSSNFNASVSPAVLVVVTTLPTAISLTGTPNPASLGQTVTLTAKATSSGPVATPAGMVTFADGGSTLGMVPLNGGGTASFTTGTLTAGTHPITASLAASASFSASVSPILNEVVTDYDFSLLISPTTITLPSGGYEAVSVALTPIAGYSGSLQLSCGSLPAHAQCDFSTTTPVSLAGGAQTIGLTLNTSDVFGYGQKVGRMEPPLAGSRSLPWPAYAILALPLLTFSRKLRSVGRNKWLSYRLLSLGSIALSLLALQACSGKLPAETAPGSYQVQVSVTDPVSGLHHAAPITLVVTQ